MSESTKHKSNTEVTGRFKPFVMLWKFIGTSNCWFLVFLAFTAWSCFFATPYPLFDGCNIIVMIGMLMIWQLSRIANAVEKKNE